MRTNIYIRKDNEDTWDAIDNKSEWVNERLDKPAIDIAVSNLPKEAYELQVAPIITKRNEDMKFCKHNAVVGFCKKGCTK